MARPLPAELRHFEHGSAGLPAVPPPLVVGSDVAFEAATPTSSCGGGEDGSRVSSVSIASAALHPERTAAKKTG
jgi:hypothetical protein